MYRLKVHLHGAEITELQLESGREYTFGRGSMCDVRLEEHSGISRSHFRIIEENGVWVAQVISKFGDLVHSGERVQSVTLEPGTVFKLADYDFYFLDTEMRRNEEPEHLNLPAAVGQDYSSPPARSAPAPAPPSNDSYDDFEGNVDVTRIISSQSEIAFLRISRPGSGEEIMQLDGRKWIAGREESCEIELRDKKASRRQFELISSPQGHFIRDLGSSNGTYLNGVQLVADELKPLKSADVIQVGAIIIHFELRDPNFEKKLMVVPDSVRSEAPIVVQNPYELINYPVMSGPGGAVRLEAPPQGNSLSVWLQAGDQETRKKKKFYLIIGAVVLFFGLMLLLGEDDKPQKAANTANEPFLRLTVDQQKQVKEHYVVATNLYMQGKLDLAGGPLKKIHELLPGGYEDSRKMEEGIQAQLEQRQMLQELELAKRRAEETRLAVESNLRECQSLASRTYNTDELRRCLAPALDLDPGNPQIERMLSQVQAKFDDRQRRMGEQRDYSARVAKGESLYFKAEAFDQKGEYFDAIDTYRKHINSPYPDPKGFKAKSQRNLLSITKRVSTKVDESIQAAETAYGSKNYKEAIDQLKKARAIDPTNEKVAELATKYRRELNIMLKEMYEESVVSEGLGLIDQAKDLWQKILKTDHPDGEYYKKARSKLKAYGAI